MKHHENKRSHSCNSLITAELNNSVRMKLDHHARRDPVASHHCSAAVCSYTARPKRALLPSWQDLLYKILDFTPLLIARPNSKHNSTTPGRATSSSSGSGIKPTQLFPVRSGLIPISCDREPHNHNEPMKGYSARASTDDWGTTA